MFIWIMFFAPMPMTRISQFLANPSLEASLILITAPIWIIGAVTLFWRKEWSWYASVYGVTVMLAQSLGIAVSGYALLTLAGDPTDGIGYSLIVGSLGILLGLPNLIGLFWKHSELLTMTTGEPNTSLAQTAQKLSEFQEHV